MKTGTINGYTQEAEKDADRTAVAYLAKSSYSPEGMLSFMKKLEAEHSEHPTESMGIYQTHPAPFKRVTSIAKALEELGQKTDVRRLRNVAYAKPTPVKEGSDQYEVVIGNKVLCEPARLSTGVSSKDRAEMIAKRINQVLDAGVNPAQISEDPAGTCLLAKGAEMLRVENEDTKLKNTSSKELLQSARATLAYAIWADWLCSGCNAAIDAMSED